MNTKLLLPTRFKIIGVFLLIPMLTLGIIRKIIGFEFPFLAMPHKPDLDDLFGNQNLTDELLLTGIIVGLLFIAFAREKHEDEFINKLRLESLQWAVLVNYVLLIAATWAIYGADYLNVMMYNMLTILAIFVIRFHVVLYKNKSLTD